MKFAVVTCYAPEHWDVYARRCVETFGQFWRGIPLMAYDGPALEQQSSWLAEFKRRHAHRPTADYRMDAVRFAHKVAAIDLGVDWARMAKADALVWMDADCVTHGEVTADWLEGLLRNGDFAYLDRAMKYPECGFMIFRLNERGIAFIEEVVRQYVSDQLFKLPEWHDSYVIDQVRAKRVQIGMLRCASLSGRASRTHHPLINGPLGEKLDHLKGPRKQTGRSHDRDLKVARTEAYWRR